MKTLRNMKCAGFVIVTGILVVLAGCQTVPPASDEAPRKEGGGIVEGEVPIYEWDPYWPKHPLPNNWAMGEVAGMDVDSQGHVWILNRPRSIIRGHQDDASYPIPESECCQVPPAVIEFDPAGNVIQGWGGPGPEFEWPRGSAGQAVPRGYDASYDAKFPRPPRIDLTPRPYHWSRGEEHGVRVDHKGNVWIGGDHLIKFTRDGKFVREFGYAANKGEMAPDSHNAEVLGPNVADVAFDPQTNEVFVADGEGSRPRRVIVLDADSGSFKRYWGAYGKPPDDSVPPRKLPFQWKPTDSPHPQFNSPHGIRIDRDGLVYVADRENSRIQVFRKDGTFVMEGFIKPTTMRGTVSFIEISKDREQRWIFVADSRNDKVWILRRSDLRVIGEFGHGGRFGGAFTLPHAIAADNENNLYVGESYSGNRVQKFVFKGTRPARRTYDRYGIAQN